MNPIAWDQEEDIAVSPERHPLDGEWAYFDYGVNPITKKHRTAKKQYHPQPNPEDLLPRDISRTDFLDKLQDINPTALGDAVISQDPIIQGLLFRLQSDSTISLDSSILKDGLDYLVEAGIMSDEDKVALLE